MDIEREMKLIRKEWYVVSRADLQRTCIELHDAVTFSTRAASLVCDSSGDRCKQHGNKSVKYGNS